MQIQKNGASVSEVLALTAVQVDKFDWSCLQKTIVNI